MNGAGGNPRRVAINAGHNEALLWMLDRYQAHAADPTDRVKAFAALRALVIACQWFGLSSKQAAVLAELGRVDQGAAAFFQIVLQERAKTKAQKDIIKRQQATMKNVSWRRFLAYIEQIGEGKRGPRGRQARCWHDDSQGRIFWNHKAACWRGSSEVARLGHI